MYEPARTGLLLVDPYNDFLSHNQRGDGDADRDDPDLPRGDDARAEGRPPQGATDLLRDVLGKPPGLTFVVIQEVDTEGWGVGGLPAAEHRRRAAAGSPG
jgi:Tautomerase enzyme